MNIVCHSAKFLKHFKPMH